MSFGGTVTRGRGRARSSTGRGDGAGRPVGARGPGASRGPNVSDDEGEIDWQRVALFGTGIALGATLGAGVALLFAPSTGEETRAAIWRQGTRFAQQGRDAWDDLREELDWAARRGKRRVGRRVQRARWAAEDFIDDRRRPDRWRGKRRSKSTVAEPEALEIDEQDVQEIVDSLV